MIPDLIVSPIRVEVKHPIACQSLAACVLSTFLFACGGTPQAFAVPPPPVQPPSQTSEVALSPVNQMNQMALDMAVAMSCSKLKGRFVPLPDPASPPFEGADVGMSLAGGRWYIHDCLAGSSGGQFSLHLSGPAWQWVNATEQGFRIEQYVYVEASVDLQGEILGAYDANTKVTSVFLLPTTWAHVEPIKTLSIAAHPTGILSAAEDLFFPETVNAGTHDAIETRGTQLFATQMGKGLTFTFTAGGQADLVLGRLPSGVVPRRPFVGSEAWLINERQALHPGGIMVAGPFVPGVPVTLDAIVEQGHPVRYHAFCSDFVVTDYDRFLGGSGFTPLVNRPDSAVLAPGQRVTTTLAPMNCPWLLATALISPSTGQVQPTSVRLRLRVAQQSTSPATMTAGASATRVPQGGRPRGYTTRPPVFPADITYKLYVNPRFAFAVDYPTFFDLNPPPQNGDGQIFSRGDHVSMTASGMLTTDTVDSDSAHESTRDGRVFYERAIVKDGIVATLILEYDEALKVDMAPIVSHVSSSFRTVRGGMYDRK
jgi:hypothetical protein